MTTYTWLFFANSMLVAVYHFDAERMKKVLGPVFYWIGFYATVMGSVSGYLSIKFPNM